MVEKLVSRRNRLLRRCRWHRWMFRANGQRKHARRAADLWRAAKKTQRAIERVRAADKKWKPFYAARFIAPFEGLRTTAYQDTGGIWTIGYGHTGKHAYPGNTISKVTALALLTQDIKWAADAVDRNVDVPLTIREKIAATSFTFNVGEGGLQSSTFLRELNKGNRKEAADALLMWTKDGNGQELAGLVRRRKAERWLFYNPRKNS